MTDPVSAERVEVRIERLLPAPAAAVFAAWTTPELMAGWLSATGQAEVRADVRPGGAFTLVMVGDGARIEHTGEYLVVDPPHRLVFTWRSAYTGERPSLVTVTLEAQGDQTRLVLTHAHLPEEHAESHRDGWGRIVDNLASLLSAAGA